MRFHLSSPAADFVAVAPAGVDLGERFDAFDVENRQWVDIYGWRCELTPTAGPIDGAELPASLRAWNSLDDAGRAAILARVGERDTMQAQFRACLAAVAGNEPPPFTGAA